jgi:hypothetical protein
MEPETLIARHLAEQFHDWCCEFDPSLAMAIERSS